jgi:hypothetical protein
LDQKGQKLSQKLLLFFACCNLFPMGQLDGAECPGVKKPLFINMDETSVALSYPGQKGNVAQQPRTTRIRPETYSEKVTLAVRRGNITYCAFVASEAFLHPCYHKF